MLYALTRPTTLAFFSRVESIQTWSENRTYGGWMAVSFRTDSPDQTLQEFQGWIANHDVDWEQWQHRHRYYTTKYSLTNDGRVSLLQSCRFAFPADWSQCL